MKALMDCMYEWFYKKTGGRVFISLDTIANAYYEIASPITFTGDFEIEIDLSTSSLDGNMIAATSGVIQDYVYVSSSSGVIGLSVAGAAFNGTIVVADGELHKFKITKVGTTLSLFVDGVPDGTATTTASSASFGNVGGWSSPSLFFNGIISNANFTDKSGAGDVVTTFRLDELTANTENSLQANNSVTYQNIAQDVRDTYILINGNWVGSELITNGDFATDSNWIKGDGWSIDTVAGTASTDGTGNNRSITQLNVPLIAGSYELTYTILSISSGQIRPQFAGGGQAVGLARPTAGTYTEVITTPINLTAFNMLSSGGSGAVATIDNISIKRLIEVAS